MIFFLPTSKNTDVRFSALRGRPGRPAARAGELRFGFQSLRSQRLKFFIKFFGVLKMRIRSILVALAAVAFLGCSSGPSISIVGDEHFFLVENGQQLELIDITVDLGTGSYVFHPGTSRLVRICDGPGDAAEPCWDPLIRSPGREWIDRVLALPPSRITGGIILHTGDFNGDLRGSVPAKVVSVTPFVIAYAREGNPAAPPAPPTDPAKPWRSLENNRFGRVIGQTRRTGLIAAGDLDAVVDEVLVYPEALAVATESGMNRSPAGLTVTHATLSRSVPLREVLAAFTRGGLADLPVGASEELPATHPLYPRSMPPGWQK